MRPTLPLPPLHSGRWLGIAPARVALASPPDEPGRGDVRRGLTYALGAAVFFSVMGILVKLGAQSMPAMQLVWARVTVTAAIGYVAIRRTGVSPWGVSRRVLLARGLLGTVALCCFYYSLATLPLGDATAIQYTNPILSGILGALLLRERIGRADVTAAALSVCGVVAIARPSFLTGAPSLPALGVVAAAAGSIVSAFVYVAVRQLRTTDHPLVIVFWFPLVALPLVTPLALRIWVWPDTAAEWMILIGIGVSTQTAQVLMTRGLHLLPVSKATAVSYVQVVIGFVAGALIFGEKPTTATLVGAGAIATGLLITAASARRAPRRPSAQPAPIGTEPG